MQENRYWEDLRNYYIEKKNANNNPQKHSRSIYAEAINEMCQKQGILKNKLNVVTNFYFRDRDCRGAERCFVAVAIVEKFPLQRFRNQNKTMKPNGATPKSPVFA
ncbi:MAG: hypothetical protein PUD00_00370 [Treponema berlinense]|uniref:hypothetical protein n=1 Tax=Treponema berlinense TaxID=225004 RepID=UPI0023EFA196|nr:hypothetical protein [Treponema berlinense]MDD5833671.1 hypothetical protein [Treponema berlinense]